MRNFILKCLILCWCVLCIAGGSCERKWDQDIEAESFGSIHGQREDVCCDLCALISACKAYSWNEYKCGTCYLKSTTGPLIYKAASNVGIKPGGTCTSHEGKDIVGEANLIGVHDQALGTCCDICRATPDCKAFAWNDFSGGTCWLKSAAGPLFPAPGITVGIITGGTITPITIPPPVITRPPPAITTGPPITTEGWIVLKRFKFNNMDEVRRNWVIKKWGAGHVNNEKQTYVDSSTNIYIENRKLVIKAIKQGDNYYTSGRLESKARFTPTEVSGNKLRVEFVAKVPTVMGAWPALWMLGIYDTYGEWPHAGEIDVMEWVHQIGDTSKAALHWKGPTDWDHDFSMNRHTMTNEFNTYGVEYSSVPNDEYIQFYLKKSNGQTMYGKKATPTEWTASFSKCSSLTAGSKRCSPLAPFDNRMYLIMNIAVGGTWGGCCGVNDYSAFTNGVTMTVQSVTVWKAGQNPAPTMVEFNANQHGA